MDCKYQYVKMSFRTCPSFQNRTLQDWFDPRSKERQQICSTKLNFKNCWIHIMLNLAVYSSDRTMLSAYPNFCACIKRIVVRTAYYCCNDYLPSTKLCDVK